MNNKGLSLVSVLVGVGLSGVLMVIMAQTMVKVVGKTNQIGTIRNVISLKKSAQAYLANKSACKHTLQNVRLIQQEDGTTQIETGKDIQVKKQEEENSYLLESIKNARGKDIFKVGKLSETNVTIDSIQVKSETGKSADNKGALDVHFKFTWEERGESKHNTERIPVYVQWEADYTNKYRVISCIDSLGMEIIGNLPKDQCKPNQLIIYDSNKFSCSDQYKPSTYFERINMIKEENITNSNIGNHRIGRSAWYYHWRTGVSWLFGVSKRNDPNSEQGYIKKQRTPYMRNKISSEKMFNIVDRRTYEPKIKKMSDGNIVEGKLTVSAYVPIREYGDGNIKTGAHIASIYYRSCNSLNTSDQCPSGVWNLMSFAAVFNLDYYYHNSAGGASTVQGQLEIESNKYYEFILDVNSLVKGGPQRAGSIFEQDHRFFGIWEFVETFK